MNKPVSATLLLLFCLALPFLSNAQNANGGETLDQIVAIVNDHIILKSDVDQQVTDYMVQMQQSRNQNVSFSKDLWYTSLQNMVDNFVMLDRAREDSVEISDERVDQQINARLDQYIQQVGSEEALEKQIGKSIVQLRSELREDYRRQMIIQQYRQERLQNITITRPEVKDYFESIPKDSLPVIPERVALSQIVSVPPPLKDARQEAYHFAEQLRDSILNHGKSIEELARRYSDGPSASNGGKLPMMSINDLVAEYSAAASALQPGEISEVVETSFGFHVIRLNKRVGDQIDTNHILIKVDNEGYDEQAAIDQLKAYKDSLQSNPDRSFHDLAREYSEDPNTAPQGGRILNPQTGERLIALNQLDPALYRIVLLLDEVGDISEPKQFNIGSNSNSKTAYRIVRLDNRVPEHVASLEQDYERIKNAALQDKQYRILSNWISELKKEVYIEYKIPVPDQYKQS